MQNIFDDWFSALYNNYTIGVILMLNQSHMGSLQTDALVCVHVYWPALAAIASALYMLYLSYINYINYLHIITDKLAASSRAERRGRPQCEMCVCVYMRSTAAAFTPKILDWQNPRK